ncbi:MAG: DNA phosphorothioation system restriction enzyme [Prochloraceae cyanobacterium]|nr:DNA phosphorothioation system restriction enzyme [Prochloraceae cyanobacterium]
MLVSINWEKLAAEYSSKKTRRFKLAENKSNYQFQPSQESPCFPPDLELRNYQAQAVISWFKNKGRGTLKMATGSGKTITALAIATELYQKIGLKAIIVICPYRHLVAQWSQECQKFNLEAIAAFESVYNWQSQLSDRLYSLISGDRSFVTVITTNSTFITPGFQSQIKYFPDKTLIIGDEAHNLGSARLIESLPRQIGLRLALSATPERYYDDDGTDFIFDYFGPILEPDFSLADAINAKALVPYLYYPILVEFTPSESFAYAKLTKKIGWALNNRDRNVGANTAVTSLLVQRSRLIAGAKNKLHALRQLMSDRLDTTHTLFYCGDARVEYDSSYVRQIDAVTRILGIELGYRINTYTAETPLLEREILQNQFETGQLQGLVSIRCLDEGVDIPAIKNAVILASTGNPRQFIQRRGRILRPHPGKDRATLFDAIVLPPELDRNTWEVERNLLRKELKRFIEFADLAENAAEAKNILLSLQDRYSL